MSLPDHYQNANGRNYFHPPHLWKQSSGSDGSMDANLQCLTLQPKLQQWEMGGVTEPVRKKETRGEDANEYQQNKGQALFQ